MTLFSLVSEMPKTMNVPEEKPEILTAEIMEKLSHMTSGQLEIIYKHGKRKVQLDNDPKVYQAMNHMVSAQLEAIFGSY